MTVHKRPDKENHGNWIDANITIFFPPERARLKMNFVSEVYLVRGENLDPGKVQEAGC